GRRGPRGPVRIAGPMTATRLSETATAPPEAGRGFGSGVDSGTGGGLGGGGRGPGPGLVTAAVLVVVLVVSLGVAVTLGAASIGVADVVASVRARLTGQDAGLSQMQEGIIWSLRMPRVLTAAAVGAGLALCGAVMQATTRNPLSDPYLLGLSSGASVGAVLALLVGAQALLPP